MCSSDLVIAERADLPAPRAETLHEEHVILIEMRADTAAVAGIADHDIVDPPIGDWAAFDASVFWPSLQFLDDQTGFDGGSARKAGEIIRVERVRPCRPLIAAEERLFLPMVAQESGNVEIREMRVGLPFGHRGADAVQWFL